MLTSRKAADLDEAACQLRTRGIDAQWIAADAGDAGDARQLVHAAVERMGCIDILVNNAGATWGAPAEDHPLDAWDKVMTLNIRSVFVFCQTVARASMIPRKNGRHQCRVGGRTARQSTADDHPRVQHQQRRAGKFHPRAGGRMGPVRHYGQCAGAGFLPEQDDQMTARQLGRRQRGKGCSAATAW